MAGGRGRQQDGHRERSQRLRPAPLAGGTAKMLKNHHLTKPVLIGEIQEDGQFDVVWQTEGEVAGDAWSDFLEGSKDLVSDWTAPLKCGNYNTKEKKCLAAAK